MQLVRGFLYSVIILHLRKMYNICDSSW